METPASEVVLLAYGEVGTKSSVVRTRMERTLATNVEAMLADRGVPGEVEREWSRLRIHSPEPARAARAAADVFGVVWARPTVECEATMEAVGDALASLAADAPEGSIAVRARRTGDHPFTSQDVEREGGARVVEASGAPVDLDDPDITYRVEVREERAFVSNRSFEGPGGLPLGSQQPLVALVSGGIDSPVAAWQTMRRGAPVIPVYVDLGEFGGPDHVARAESTVAGLARYAPRRDLRLHLVPGGELVDRLVAEVDDTRMLSLRRAMVAVGEAVAREEGAHGVVTGEALGQKSSQTAANIAVTDAAASLPVHRPLFAADKTDIVARAREIGTYRDATLNVGCERVAPTRPETNATLEQVEAAEPDDLFELVERAVERRELVDPSA